MKSLPSERGQAMVLIVFAIIGLFGMAALAIDMGQIFAARRNAQNAADAAALAAAYEASAGSLDNVTAKKVALSMALTNGFNNDEVTNWVRVNNPPVDGPYCGDCGTVEDPNEYYQVLITARLQPVFAQFVFRGIEQVSVEAVAHASLADEMSAGNALMALNEDDDKALNMDGNTKVHITGGNMRSNGGMTKKGGSGTINVEDPAKVFYASGFDGKFSPFTGSQPEAGAVVRFGSFNPPACPTAAEAESWDSGGDFKYKETDGVTTYYYSDGLTVDNLPPGIHCIDGGISKGDITGTGVLVVLLSGDVKMTGGDSFDLRAATDMKDANGNQWGGLVFFAPPSNAASFRFGGNAGGYFQGIVFAPAADCDIGGTPDGRAIHSAIICDTIKIHGTPDLTIEYVPEELFHLPPMVELVQ